MTASERAAAQRTASVRAAALRGARRVGSHVVAQWLLFVAVHIWLQYLNLTAPGLPLGDVSVLYRFWVEQALEQGVWVGIDTMSVYPILAILPMLASYVAGPELYATTWLTLMMALNAVAFAALIGRGPRAAHPLVASWWMLFLALLGPITLGRIDTVTVAVSMLAVALLATHPRWAGVLLAVGGWIKVWPGALILAAAIALWHRVRFATAVVVFSIVIVSVGIALGAGAALFSSVTAQATRGLQVEAPISTPWMWTAFTDQWSTQVYYDRDLITWQVFGDGTQLFADLMTPVLALVILAIAALGIAAVRRGVHETRVLPPLALAIVMAMIVVNKVGSPQFVSWIAVPIALGLLWRARGGVSFAFPASAALLIAALTQILYPVLYGYLLGLYAPMLWVLTVRNLLYIVLLGWAIVVLVRLVREPIAALPDPAPRNSALLDRKDLSS